MDISESPLLGILDFQGLCGTCWEDWDVPGSLTKFRDRVGAELDRKHQVRVTSTSAIADPLPLVLSPRLTAQTLEQQYVCGAKGCGMKSAQGENARPESLRKAT
jgi:hypothetical protein